MTKIRRRAIFGRPQQKDSQPDHSLDGAKKLLLRSVFLLGPPARAPAAAPLCRVGGLFTLRPRSLSADVGFQSSSASFRRPRMITPILYSVCGDDNEPKVPSQLSHPILLLPQ